MRDFNLKKFIVENKMVRSVLKENQGEFKIWIEQGEIENIGEAYFVQAVYYDKNQDDYLDISEHPTLSGLSNLLGSGLYTINPVKQYDGDGEFESYNTTSEFNFESSEKLKQFIETELENVLNS